MDDDLRAAPTEPLPSAAPNAQDVSPEPSSPGPTSLGPTPVDPTPPLTVEFEPPRPPDVERVRVLLDDAQARADQARPADQPSSRTGRALRAVAGVNEPVLDRFPGERSKFTALGGVIIGTASIAGVSMWFAVHNALGENPAVAAAIAVIWAIFIGNLDRWLVSSMSLNSSRSAWARFGLVLPRLALAVLFAVVIAEPLVLRLFDTAIVAEVQETRRAAVRDLESQLSQCNPQLPVDAALLPASCTAQAAILNVKGAPVSELQRLGTLKTQALVDKAALDDDRRKLTRLWNIARRECTGKSGNGLTGIPGEGFNCRQDRAEARAFEKSANVDGRQAALDELNGKIVRLTNRTNAALVKYGAAVDVAIEAKVDELRASQGRIGLLERVEALGRLSEASGFVNTATWALRLLFIAIECLPVLVKALSGPGYYERALVERLRVSQDLDRERAAAEVAVERLPLGVRRILAEHDLDDARAEVSSAAEVGQVQRAAVLEAVRGHVVDVRRPARPDPNQFESYTEAAPIDAHRGNGHGSLEPPPD